MVRILSTHLENVTIIGRPSLSPTSRERIWSQPPMARWNAGVVGMSEPHLAARSTGNALSHRRAAVFLERGRIKHAVGDVLTLLALSDALADFLGVKLQTHIRIARPHPVPFPITDHAPPGQHLPVDGIVILDDDPPTNRVASRFR
jgi:hypothetical protein